ncbi:aminopeptidase N-like [Venturia canescens]|uniref:aminopeptidase N-like n=1 Tax=Venturia canescens TaxID=32260 RepID=UPI001C9C4535|nr:aminopeptidase N-like [Venturia canescens]
MENWGLVTYRENALLHDHHSTTEAKQDVVKLLAHEFAHQWFGNLVTPSWWSSLWLSEGFATYFEYWINDKVQPSWRMMDQFVIEILQQKAFHADDNEAQVAMDVTMELNSPIQILITAFNSVAYFKASCVIRMFVHVLTPNVFQTGLQNYLKAKSYQAATSGDLIRELTAVSRDIEFLDKALVSWIKQPGYPVLTVTRDYKTGNADISQKRFLTESRGARKEKWFVPINVVSGQEPASFSDTNPTHWLRDDEEALKLSGLDANNWIILNSQQTGYYRVNYDARNWQLIINYLKDPNTMKNIHVLNRAQLLDDAFHLAEAGELPDHSIFLEMTNYLQHEEDFVPWYAAHRAFEVLDRALRNTAIYDRYKLYVLRLITKLEKKLGFSGNEDESDDVKLNRLNVIKLACSVGSIKCMTAYAMMLLHVYGLGKAPADFQSVAFCAGMRFATKAVWEIAYNYTTWLSSDSSEYRNLVNALGCSSDEEILKLYLEKAFITECKIDRNDAAKSVQNGDAAGVNAFLAFVEEKFQAIVDKYGPGEIVTILTNNADKITTYEQYERMYALPNLFCDEHLDLAYDLDPADTIAWNSVEFSKKITDTATKFLSAQNLVEQ